MKKSFFYTITVIALLTVAGGKGICQSQMTLTTAPNTLEVHIRLSGTDSVTVDWGDGKKNNFIISNAYDECSGRDFTSCRHTYSNTSTHIITIIGKNINVLHCSDNQLIRLDVSNNTALEELDCYDNKLTKLDVSKNTKLKYLHCYENLLTELNVGGCSDLQTLRCRDNLFTNLDITKNIALTTLDCKRNKLTSLDVTHCTKLRDLVCQSNYLANLDVSKNVLLEDLHCYDNQLISLDIRTNTALTVLDCAGNQLTNLDIGENIKLYRINCDRNNFSEKALNALFVSLHNKPVLYNYKKSVYIYGNPGTDICDKSIAEKKNWKVVIREGKNHTNG